MQEQTFGQELVEQAHQLTRLLDKNKAILTSVAEGVVVFNLDGRATAANSTATHLLDKTMAEIKGSHISDLIGKRVTCWADQEEFEIEREETSLVVHLAPVHDVEGQAVGAVALIHDFTQEARIERLKNDFLTLASHELRTPLNAVLGYIGMLQENVYGPLTDRQQDALNRASANTGQLVTLINAFLDQVQMNAGHLNLNEAPFAPEKLVRGVQKIMGVAAQRKGLELTGRVSPAAPPLLVGDVQRLYQILVNLVANSIKFTEKGTVGIAIFRYDADRWALEVEDTGCGIPEQAQNDIFIPFLQAEEPSRRQYGGIGLGLSIVRQLVNLMNGEIKMKSQVGEGSTFTVILPLASYPSSNHSILARSKS